jgi:hypothetical protein
MALNIKRTVLIVVTSLLLLLSVRAAVSLSAESKDPFSLDILDKESPSNKYQRIEPVQPLSRESSGMYEDVAPNHWAYQAVKHLREIGLLGGYEGNIFQGDRPVTRYELSVMIARLVNNFNYYVEHGALPPDETNLLPVPTATVEPTPIVAPSGTAAGGESAQTLSHRSEISALPPGEMVWLDSRPELGPARPLSHSRPKTLEVKDTTEAASGAQPAAAAPANTAKQKQEPAKDTSKNTKDANAPKVPKEFDKLSKKVELSDKDVEILIALVDYMKKDLSKEIKADLKKDITEINRQVEKNKRDIQKLQEENERFTVTGSASVSYSSSTSEKSGSHASSGTSRWISTNLYSKPRKFDDLYFRSSLTGGGGDLTMYYQDLDTNKDRAKNFRLRTLYAGGVSFGSSYLTSSGVDFTGFQSSYKLNRYTLKSSLGKINSNRYIHGESIQFSIFGEDRSWLYLTNLSIWDDADVVAADEKNSVRSAYFRYPMPVDGLFMTAEYAHSTYHRPEIKLAMAGKSPDYDWGDQFVDWLYLPEQSEQDDAWFVLLDYNKGPLSIFPFGYVNLGPKFASKYLGLPGFSADSFGIDLLPINLQSLAVWVLRGTITKTEKKYKDDFIYVAGGETKPMFLDTNAVADDSSMDIVRGLNLFARLNNRGPDGTIDLTYFNNVVSYYMTDDISFSWTYSYVKAGLGPTCVDGNYTYVLDDSGKAIYSYIGDGKAICDTSSPYYEGDLEIMLRFLQSSQEMSMYWKTSKKAEFTWDYGFSDNSLNIESNVTQIKDAVATLMKQGRNYYSKFYLKYRTTDVSYLEMWYRSYYGRQDIHIMENDKYLSTEVGITFSMDY